MKLDESLFLQFLIVQQLLMQMRLLQLKFTHEITYKQRNKTCIMDKRQRIAARCTFLFTSYRINLTST